MARQVRQTLPDAPPQYDQQYVAALARSLNNYMGQAQALAEVIAGRYIMTDPIRIPGDLPNTGGLPVGTLYLKKTPAPPTATAQAASPTGTSSTAWVRMGLTMPFTVRDTTKFVFTMDGHVGNTGNAETGVNLAYGTGVPPANGAPLAGALIGQGVYYTGPSSGAVAPFSRTVLLSSLASGAVYWIDAAVKVTGGTSILSKVTITAVGLRDADEYFLTVVTEQDL